MAAVSSIANSLAQLISGSSEGATAPAADATPSTPVSPPNSDPATFVTLSEQAKLAAATRAQSDQAAAASLQAYVAAHHVGHGGAAQTSTASNVQSLFGATTQPVTPQPSSDSSNVTAIYTQIHAELDANQPPAFQSFTPTKSISNSVTVDGYTLSLSTNSLTQFFGIEVSGNGVQAFNKHFGPSAGAGGTNAAPPGVSVTSGLLSNNQAIDAITITRNVAAASSASVSTSKGSASASEVDAESSSITFLVNYATGEIRVQESDVSVSARAVQTGGPAQRYSAFA